MARAWAELRQLSEDELIREDDKQVRTTTTEGLAFLREVIFQRDYAEQGDRMEAGVFTGLPDSISLEEASRARCL